VTTVWAALVAAVEMACAPLLTTSVAQSAQMSQHLHHAESR